MGRPRSDALAAVHETTAGLAKVGVITKQTMKSFDAMCPLAPCSGATARRGAVRAR